MLHSTVNNKKLTPDGMDVHTEEWKLITSGKT